MKVASLLVCWFSFLDQIRLQPQVEPYLPWEGIEGPWGECELKCPEGVCPEGDGWLYPSMVLSGGTFMTIPGVSTARVCQFLCNANPDCEFFTQDEACELKNRNTGEMLSEQKDGAFSGVKCIEGSPMQYETNYAGADIGYNIIVDDELKCQQECRYTGICHYWTFDKSISRCYLKKNYGWTIREKEVAISGTGS